MDANARSHSKTSLIVSGSSRRKYSSAALVGRDAAGGGLRITKSTKLTQLLLSSCTRRITGGFPLKAMRYRGWKERKERRREKKDNGDDSSV